MTNITRRKFLGNTLATGALMTRTFNPFSNPGSGYDNSGAHRAHPLDGIQRENIKILDIKVTLLSYETPAAKQWIPSWEPPVYVWWKTDSILVEVLTDKGITGIGGSSRYGGGIEETKKHIEEYIKPLIIGKNPWDMEFFAYTGRDSLRRASWAGITAALWDIIGKACNRPVYDLLATDNEPVKHIPCYASCGEVYSGSIWPDDLIDEGLRYKEKGYLAFKFRTGIYWETSKMTVAKFAGYLEKLRNAVGPDFGLILEANGLFTLQQALEIAPALEDLKFTWFEKPMSEEGPEAAGNYFKIKEVLPTVRIAGLEKEMQRDKISDWLEKDVIDIVQPDCSIAGISESWYTSRTANIFDKLVCPHNYQCGFTTMQNAHLAAGIPNLFMLEMCECFDPLKEGVFKEPLKFNKGYLELSEKPGFGLEVAENIEKKFPYIPGPYQKLRSKSGS